MTEPGNDEGPVPQPGARPRPYPEGGGFAVQQETPAQRRSARVAVAVGGVVVLLLAALVVVLVLTLRPTVLDPAAVERDVAVQFEQLEGVAVDLSCPAEMPVASGEEYSCTGTTAEGEEVTLVIQIGDELDGAYSWTEVRN